MANKFIRRSYRLSGMLVRIDVGAVGWPGVGAKKSPLGAGFGVVVPFYAALRSGCVGISLAAARAAASASEAFSRNMDFSSQSTQRVRIWRIRGWYQSLKMGTGGA